MPWVKHSSERATNKKLRAAGLAARGLEDAVMEQMAADGVTVTRHFEVHGKQRRGDAFVDEATVLAVAGVNGATKKQATALVDLLVMYGRWEVADGGWWVLNYLEFNLTKDEWDDLSGKRQASGKAGGKARAQALAKASAQPSAQANLYPSSSSSEDEDVIANESREDAALRILAEQQLARRDDIGNPEAWLESVVESLRRVHARRLTEAPPELDAPALAAFLTASSPDRPRVVGGGARIPAPPAKPCPTCDGTGWQESPEGEMVRCAACQGTRAAS